MLIIGVDTGGTFTDFIYKDGERWGVLKLLSTPDDPSRAVLEGISRIIGEAGGEGARFQVVHGSTVATNAILERKGVPTALVTNSGFEDVIEIGRQNRSRLYDLAYRKEPHIVPARLRFGVAGRIDHEGSEVEPLDAEEAAAVARRVRESGAESVAVCLLFSFANPAHEKIVAGLLGEQGLEVSVSHEILAEFREFERTSTTLVNAYVSPRMSAYLTRIEERITGAGGSGVLRVMQSNGGQISALTARRESVRTILSGPAGGAVGAHALGAAAGFDKLITFDMGGTSSDVCLIDGDLPLSLESAISGYPVKVPMIDIHTVGAGGGSIARIDAGGSLTVGPESAGADPGPICYGKGEMITVTDANLYLNRLIPERFLGGAMRLDAERIQEPFAEMAAKLKLPAAEVAEGILAVANANMERAIRVISVERGFDPREFTLFSFGGAGSMHCAQLARQLMIPRVLVPVNPGILSAVGMVMADVIKDFSITAMLPAAETSAPDLRGRFAPIEEQARRELAAEGFMGEAVILERYLDMRYQGQSFEIITPFEEDFRAAFERLHQSTYGYINESKPIEVVNLRLRARGRPEKPRLEKRPLGESEPAPAAVLGSRQTIFEGRARTTTIYDRERLAPGNEFAGPAVLVEYSSTVVVPPFARGRVDEYSNLILEIETRTG